MAALDDTAHAEASTGAAGNVSAGAVNNSERPCPLCGTHEAHPFLRADDPKFSVVVCAKCGLRYTRPLPNEGELAALYTENYYVRNSSRLLSTDTFRRLFQYSVLWQHRRTFAERQSGRILDVGCGNGDFLAALKARGWEVYGTEFSPAACDLAREKGVAVQQGDLLSAAFPDGFFDVVTLWHVFEHLPEPRNELAEIQRILSSDGLLVIEVPNNGSLGFRLTKKKWYHFDVPRHLQHFTPETLRQILLDTSFHPVSSTLALRRSSGGVAERAGQALHEGARDFNHVG